MRNWPFLASHFLSILFALLTTFVAWWVPWKAEAASSTIKIVVKDSILNFATPVPWLGAVIVAWVVFVVKSSQFTERLEEVDALRDSFDLIDKELYDENEAHRETKESYYKSLCSSLKYILCQVETGFSADCRVTVYRVDENDHAVFRNIFRFASQHQFNGPGRDEIPVDQGLVGLSYATSAMREFRTDHAFQSENYKDELLAQLQEHGIEMPPEGTRMPSKHVVAKTISDIISGDQVGVIVYESTTNKCLNRDMIEQLLTQEDQNISRFVKHLAVLDAEFSPG